MEKMIISAKDYCSEMNSNSTLLVTVFAVDENSKSFDADVAYISLIEPKIDVQVGYKK